VQQGFSDPKSRTLIKQLEAKIGEQELQLQYSTTLLSKTIVKSPTDGIAIIDESHEWDGQPVSTGEKVMTIAQPNQVELQIWLPVANAVSFKVGDKIKLYANDNPLKPMYGTINYTSYSAVMTPSKVLAYRLTAQLEDKPLPQIGVQGTAKIYGHKVSMIYYLLRRPLAALRQTLGW
jgi:hypothetical protein